MLQRLGLCMAAGFLALAGTGCVDSVMTVEVNPDGSGQIIQEVLMTPQAVAMMQGFGGGADGAGAAAIYDEAKFKAMVPGFGKGVTFKSGKEVSKPNGSKGARVVFAFEDVTQLNLTPELGPGDDQPAAGAENPITFGFKKGATPTLTVKMPPKDKGDAEEAAPEDDAPADPQAEAMMNRMKPMMEGMRVRMQVKVIGTIQKTNASYVGADETDASQKVVTLLDMQLGKLISDPAKFKRLGKAQNIKDPMKQLELLKDFPEIKFEVKDSIDIQFK